MTTSADEVKCRDVSLFETLLDKFDELIINVGGREKYVVWDIERCKALIKYIDQDDPFVKPRICIRNHTSLTDHGQF